MGENQFDGKSHLSILNVTSRFVSNFSTRKIFQPSALS